MLVASPPAVVLVTGASSGIGQATARLFAGRGARVFGTSRHQHPGEPGIEMLQLDVRSEDSVRECTGQVLNRAGTIDVLVNNAGVMLEGFAEETSPAEARAVFETNLFGATGVANAVLPHMRAQRSGRIINVGSLAAWIGEPGEAFYAASKAALACYTEALRHEVWHLGIRVSLVEPGPFVTGALRTPVTARPSIPDYNGPRENAARTLHDAMRTGGKPQAAAKAIYRAATARAPKGRYGTGRGAHTIPRLRTLVPQRIFDTLLRHGYHLPP